MLAMSCPSVDICVAEGNGPASSTAFSETTVYSTDPGAGSSWKGLPNPSAPGGKAAFLANQISCPTTSLCVDIGDGQRGAHRRQAQVFAIQNLSQPQPRWKLVGGGALDASPLASDLSCPTADFCAELTANREAAQHGAFWVSAHPGDPGSWRERAYPRDAAYMFCPTARLCLADVVDRTREGHLMSLSAPLSAASRWHDYPVSLPGRNQQVESGSCSRSGACIMSVEAFRSGKALSGTVLATSNIASGASSWMRSYTSTHVEFVPFGHGGCFSNGSCYTTAYSAKTGWSLAVSAHPATRRPSWWAVPASGFATCATADTCFDSVAMRPYSGKHLGHGIETIHLSR